MNKKIIIVVLSLMICGGAFAQSYGDIYDKSIPDARKINYPYLREADVVWSKRYYRILDLKEKMNHPLYYPTDTTIKDGRKSFINILFDEIQKGNIKAFDFFANTVPTTYDDVLKKTGSKEVLVTGRVDANNNPLPDTTVTSPPSREDVKKLILYEEWYFDKKHSNLQVRIIAVIPYFKGYNDALGKEENTPVCWVWFDDIRDLLARYEVFSPRNDAQRISFEDFFMQRRFSSYINAESNVYNDREITQYLVGKPALFEAERLKSELFTFEHDLWEY